MHLKLRITNELIQGFRSFARPKPLNTKNFKEVFLTSSCKRTKEEKMHQFFFLFSPTWALKHLWNWRDNRKAFSHIIGSQVNNNSLCQNVNIEQPSIYWAARYEFSKLTRTKTLKRLDFPMMALYRNRATTSYPQHN